MPNDTALTGNGTIMQAGGAAGLGLVMGRSGWAAARPLAPGVLKQPAQHRTSTPQPACPAPHASRRTPTQINTLFPSPKTEEGIKGGVVGAAPGRAGKGEQGRSAAGARLPSEHAPT